MAYRNFSEIAVANTSRDNVPPAIEQAGFAPLEWIVVALAQRDPLASLKTPGRMAIALRVLFGGRSNSPLADPRLEALRRFVIITHHLGDRLPPAEVTHFLEAGFNRAQMLQLRHSNTVS